MKSMTPSECHAFLLFGKRTAKVATVPPDGRPHVAPVWFILDSDKLVFMTGKDTVKGKNILRDSRVMLSIDDERPPFAFVLIEGAAVASELSQRAIGLAPLPGFNRAWSIACGGFRVGVARSVRVYTRMSSWLIFRNQCRCRRALLPQGWQD